MMMGGVCLQWAFVSMYIMLPAVLVLRMHCGFWLCGEAVCVAGSGFDSGSAEVGGRECFLVLLFGFWRWRLRSAACLYAAGSLMRSDVAAELPTRLSGWALRSRRVGGGSALSGTGVRQRRRAVCSIVWYVSVENVENRVFIWVEQRL
jgi:hypothetical protein